MKQLQISFYVKSMEHEKKEDEGGGPKKRGPKRRNSATAGGALPKQTRPRKRGRPANSIDSGLDLTVQKQDTPNGPKTTKKRKRVLADEGEANRQVVGSPQPPQLQQQLQQTTTLVPEGVMSSSPSGHFVILPRTGDKFFEDLIDEERRVQRRRSVMEKETAEAVERQAQTQEMEKILERASQALAQARLSDEAEDLEATMLRNNERFVKRYKQHFFLAGTYADPLSFCNRLVVERLEWLRERDGSIQEADLEAVKEHVLRQVEEKAKAIQSRRMALRKEVATTNEEGEGEDPEASESPLL